MRNKKVQLQQFRQGAILMFFMAFGTGVGAGETEERIIDKAVTAYGGDKLMGLRNLRYSDNLYHFYEMQSGHTLQGSHTSHLEQHQLQVTIDLENKRKELKRASNRLVGNHGRLNVTTNHQFFADGKGYAIDHCSQQYQPLNGLDYYNADMGYSQMLDPVIIRQLAQDKRHSQWLDTANIQGQTHDVLKVTPENRSAYTLFINRDTGYLTRMLQQRGKQTRSYDFLGHQQTQGITWARQMFVGTELQPLYHTVSRQLDFNLEQDLQFSVPEQYQLRPQSQWFDASKLTVRQLADGVYFVGQDWGYTLFVDVGEYYISMGAWQMDESNLAWLKRLELLQQTTGNRKPVGQHIVTHHHTDHMAGLKDILASGSKLLVNTTDINAVKKHLQGQVTQQQIVPVTVSDTKPLAGGKLVLFDLPTSHASHNLMVYLPQQKLLFTEDIFGSSYQTEFEPVNSWPILDTYQRLRALDNKVKQLGLEVEQYVSSHHARVLTQEEVNQALTLGCPDSSELKQRLFSE